MHKLIKLSILLHPKYPIILLLLIIVFACNTKPEKVIIDENSLQLYPVKEKKLRKRQLKTLHNSVQTFYNTYLNRTRFSGEILVAKNGTIIFENYSGYSNVETKESINEHSSLHIASTSKTFTAMAILQLAKNRMLNINDTVGKYLKNFPYQGITIKMLMNHRSGIPNYLYFIDPKNYPSEYKLSNKDVLNYLIENNPAPSYRPDTHFNYCNTNYVLLALIIEKVSGKLYPDFIKKHFFIPLEMKDSYVYTANDSASYLKSFYPNGKTWSQDIFDGTYGDKNIYTTAADLLKWSMALSNKKTFSFEILDSAFSSYSNERISMHNYGLGWRILQMKNGKKIIYHHGRWHGSNSFFAMIPEENVTIIIIGNKFNRNIYKGNLLYDIFGSEYHNIESNTLSDSIDLGSPK